MKFFVAVDEGRRFCEFNFKGMTVWFPGQRIAFAKVNRLGSRPLTCVDNRFFAARQCDSFGLSLFLAAGYFEREEQDQDKTNPTDIPNLSRSHFNLPHLS